MQGGPHDGGNDLTEFVASLSLTPEQTLTVVAHSFGSIVTGAALADAGLQVTDVVVAGSPGMTVDDLRACISSSRTSSPSRRPATPLPSWGSSGPPPPHRSSAARG